MHKEITDDLLYTFFNNCIGNSPTQFRFILVFNPYTLNAFSLFPDDFRDHSTKILFIESEIHKYIC